MNLVIDAGNSLVKLAVFEGGIVRSKQQVEYAGFFEVFLEIKSHYPKITKIILSSVSALDKSAIEKVLNNEQLLVLDCNTQMPFVNLYSTPKTLGVDRLALVAGASKLYSNKNCLIIDAGTCVTYDFLDEKGAYKGGGISPGLQLRYKSLNDHTANLPKLEAIAYDGLIGDSTENAIHAGVFNGFVSEINGIIEQFSNTFGSLVVILTGGDANFLSKRLKSSIFVDPNFLFKGLNFILDFNTSK
ncbi:type III pantothenate kinase [Aquimarina agarilytica]|uniref:type III pantothenate kinase n=1 Tax=Aquimarina agarilytica TaxID=1087449 RepID=UPI000492685F|nr:type III pantothenate kinase [Aquimarina agarilytica]